jgi:hypothetical protein
VSKPLIAITLTIYAWVAFDQARKGNWPMVICYSGWSFANIGLMLQVK